MSELDELLGTNQAQTGVNPFKSEEVQYLRNKIIFQAILTVTVYPNGKMAAHISRPLSPKQQLSPRTKKHGQKKASSLGREETY